MDEVSEETLSSARDGPAGKIAKSMLNSLIGDTLCSENPPEDASCEVEGGPPDGFEGDVTISKDITEEQITEEGLSSARDGPAGLIAKSMIISKTGSLSEENVTMATRGINEEDLSQLTIASPTSTEIGEALVSDVMTKVKEDLEAASCHGNEEDNTELVQNDKETGEDVVDGLVNGDLPVNGDENFVDIDLNSADNEENVENIEENIIDNNEDNNEENIEENVDENIEENNEEIEGNIEENVEEIMEKEGEASEEIIAEVEMSETEVTSQINDCQDAASQSDDVESPEKSGEEAPPVAIDDGVPDSPTDAEPCSVVEGATVISGVELTPKIAGTQDSETNSDPDPVDRIAVKMDFVDSTECEDTELTEMSYEENVVITREEIREDEIVMSMNPRYSADKESVLEMLVPPVIVERELLVPICQIQTEQETIEQIAPTRRLSVTVDDTMKVAMLEETVAALKKSLGNSEEKLTTQDEELKSATEQLETNKVTMEEKIKKYEIQLSHVMGQLRALKDNSAGKRNGVEDADTKEKLQTDIKTYQEQVKQDVVAICALEERLDKVVKKNKDYQVEVKELAKTVLNLKTERQALVSRIQQLELSGLGTSNSPPPVPKVLFQRSINSDVASAEVIRLRQENVQLKKEISEQRHCIEGLRRDLVGADARLSDMAGELSESQKEALEAADAKVIEKEAELAEVKGQVKELGQLVENYKAEVVSLKDNLKDQKNVVDEFRGTVSDQNNQIKDLQNQLKANVKRNKESANLQQSKNSPRSKSTANNEGYIAKDLSAIGSQCKGERHNETIYHQREALAELRARVKALEQIKPSSSSTQDQALSQIFVLKRELAELRAKQASQTLDQRHHIIRKIQNQVTEGREEVSGSTEGQAHQGLGIRSPSPSLGLPSINKSLESKQRLTALLKDPKNTRPRVLQNGDEFSLEEKPRSPISAWLEGSNSSEDHPSRGTPLAETDVSFSFFRQPAPPGGPRNTGRSSSRSRPRSATPMQERGIEDVLNERESFETLTSKRNQAEVELERSAHSETSKALELSEEIYLQTLKTLANQLGLSEIPGATTIAHSPQDERESVGARRLEALQILSTRVSALKKRIERKDDLLQGYEGDLDKLRKAEQSNKEWNKQVENLSAELRTKTEEGHYLRESLSRTREKLDQELRLNSAIKLKKDTDGMFASMLPKWILSHVCLTCRHTLQNNEKTFHLENEFTHKNPTKGRPASATDEKKKKDHVEILRKKNYEIKLLKTTLTEKEKELYDIKRRFTILQDMHKNINLDSSGYSSRRSSAGKSRPLAVHSKQTKRQSQSSISFQEGIVEIPLETESMLVSQSEELTTTADQSGPLTTESQSEFTTDVTNQSEFNENSNDQSEERNEAIDQSEAGNTDLIDEDGVIVGDTQTEAEMML